MAMTGLAQEARERPILFSGVMVRAILESRKTQTRRVLRKSPLTGPPYYFDHISYDLGYPASLDSAWAGFRYEGQDADASALYERCPYGKPGGRLWVRETWRERGSAQREDGKLGVGPSFYRGALYRADGNEWDGPWRPSIFMPRAASRITLEITGVRVELLQGITEEDAKAEGMVAGVCTHPDCSPGSCAASRYRPAFAEGWNKLNAKRGFGWDTNPLVWVLSFRRLTKDSRA